MRKILEKLKNATGISGKHPKRVAIVTGANRGIGKETCRQLAQKGITVVLTSRDPKKGKEAADELIQEGLDVTFHQLDVTDPGSIASLTSHVGKSFGRIDILINNAATSFDGEDGGIEINLSQARQTIETNFWGPWLLCQVVIPFMKDNGFGRIVNLSSGMGQLTHMEGGMPSYRISKTSLNALTRILAAELKGTNVLVNSADPGWVRTNDPRAPLTVEEGADTPVWLATINDDGPTGGVFRERKPIEW